MTRGKLKLLVYGIGFGFVTLRSLYILIFVGVDTQEEYDRM